MSKVKLDNHLVDFNACVALMDDDIREELHNCGVDWDSLDDQKFLEAYLEKHREKFESEFTI